jgi:hypothetical protein
MHVAIPASSVPSESAFSMVGRIIDDYRASLKPETVQALMLSKAWIQFYWKHPDVLPRPKYIFPPSKRNNDQNTSSTNSLEEQEIL